MKRFLGVFIVFLSFLVILQPLSVPLVSAKESVDRDEQIINDATSGEDFNWDDVEWITVDDYIDNDEEVLLDDDEFDEDFEYINLKEGEEYSSDFDFKIINEEDPRFDEAEFRPYLWGLIARVVLSGGKYVVKYGSKIFKKQPKSKAVNHTKNFTPARVNIGGGNTIVLQRSSMNHILQRHHPKFWTGATNKTLFNPSISSAKIRGQIISIINKNRSKIKNGYGTINVKIDGQKYRLVISNYRVNTFYPVR
ncbi:hypothetical protein [Shouchella clausii]|uniref:hypothetical protein n=1 Tax=Shouchella clausii TaxID=79880 RepID=UPI000BA6D9CD|nr:hypothetical protein [Shouchella clausii]PAE92132.1 hypothetical protein CHH70_16515 [Shouchella clausii]